MKSFKIGYSKPDLVIFSFKYSYNLYFPNFLPFVILEFLEVNNFFKKSDLIVKLHCHVVGRAKIFSLLDSLSWFLKNLLVFGDIYALLDEYFLLKLKLFSFFPCILCFSPQMFLWCNFVFECLPIFHFWFWYFSLKHQIMH